MAIIYFWIQAESYIIHVESHEAHVADKPLGATPKAQEAGKPVDNTAGVAPGVDRIMTTAENPGNLKKETGPTLD